MERVERKSHFERASKQWECELSIICQKIEHGYRGEIQSFINSSYFLSFFIAQNNEDG